MNFTVSTFDGSPLRTGRRARRCEWPNGILKSNAEPEHEAQADFNIFASWNGGKSEIDHCYCAEHTRQAVKLLVERMGAGDIE